MKNNSFDRAMDSIVAQAEAERQQEIKAALRAEWFGRLRSAFILLFVATVLIFAYNFHDIWVKFARPCCRTRQPIPQRAQPGNRAAKPPWPCRARSKMPPSATNSLIRSRSKKRFAVSY